MSPQPQAKNTRNGAPTPLDPDEFPHPPKAGAHGLKTTLENVEYLLKGYDITARFDVIKKRLVILRDGKTCSQSDIASLAILNGLNGNWLMPFIDAIARRNPLNPVKDWIENKPWDGVERLADFHATVRTVDDYPDGLKEILLFRWLLSAVAAATLEGRRFSTRGVLTLQGGQGIGKTSWITRLMPEGELNDTVIKRDHHLDGANKDSILGAISHWIVEIGELDSSFKKDVARLKGFLTNDCDKIRPPYGKEAVEYDRRTVFAATVNEATFLVDPTGNSRFWTLAVESLDYSHDIDMQQLFAQLKIKLDEGEQWWLKPGEEQVLERYNLRHRAVSAIAERIREHVDSEADDAAIEKAKYTTAIGLLSDIGIDRPTNAQCREAGSVLRELFGQPKRVQGRDQWRVPLRGGFSGNYPPGAAGEVFE